MYNDRIKIYVTHNIKEISLTVYVKRYESITISTLHTFEHLIWQRSIFRDNVYINWRMHYRFEFL